MPTPSPPLRDKKCLAVPFTQLRRSFFASPAVLVGPAPGGRCVFSLPRTSYLCFMKLAESLGFHQCYSTKTATAASTAAITAARPAAVPCDFKVTLAFIFFSIYLVIYLFLCMFFFCLFYLLGPFSAFSPPFFLLSPYYPLSPFMSPLLFPLLSPSTRSLRRPRKSPRGGVSFCSASCCIAGTFCSLCVAISGLSDSSEV